MPCYSPLSARKLGGGGITFNLGGLSRDAARALGAIDIPCGQCLGCRLQRSRDWSIRCMHEAQLHQDNCYVTLTYSDENLPANKSLDYRDFQLFMKRLRRYALQPTRFYMCGEYGTQNHRPHYHACLFGFKPDDLVSHKKNQNGDVLYRSAILDKLWGKNDPDGAPTLVGEVTRQSAGYCARYILQKVTGDLAEAHYQGRVPEFNQMSLRPGIGAGWLKRFRSDFFPCDYVVDDGHKDRVPKYYDKLNGRFSPEQFAAVQLARQLSAGPHWADNTSSRLRVKELVQRAASRSLLRPL